MSRSENITAIASKLHDARRTLRRLMGDKYAKYASRWMEVVDAVADGGDHLRTCMDLISDLQARDDDGMGQLWLLAATVELIEPDELTPTLEADV